MGSRRWRAGAAGAALACALVAALPPGSPLWLALARGTSVVAALVFLAAVVHMPSEVRAVWWGLWVFQCLTIAGDIVYDALRYGLGVEPFPSAADGLYLASYGAILAALVVLVNKRFPGRDREAWIDTAIMTVAAMTAVGTFIILPMVDHAGGRDWGTWIALSYPVMDLVILSTLIRLVVGAVGSTRPWPCWSPPWVPPSPRTSCSAAWSRAGRWRPPGAGSTPPSWQPSCCSPSR